MLALVIELLGRQGIDVELPAPQRFAGANGRGGAHGEVDRRERFGRPDVHSPNRFVADARRREGRHAAALELQPGVGHVFVPADDRRADGVNLAQRAADHRQHEINVVDHQIENHADIRRAEGESAGPDRFDILGRADPRGNGMEGGIEPLDVSHLKDDVSLLRGGDQLFGVGYAVQSGFSTRSGMPAAQEIAGNPVVKTRRRGDDGGVEAIEYVRVVGRRLAMALGGDSVAAGRDWIDDGQEIDVVDRAASFWAWKPPSRPAPTTAIRSLFMVGFYAACAVRGRGRAGLRAGLGRS